MWLSSNASLEMAEIVAEHPVTALAVLFGLGIWSFTSLTKVMKSRVFIGYLRYSPIFTEGPKNIFSERLTYRINLVYSQMARG